MFGFTKAEKTIVMFLIISAFVGSCVVAVKKMNPNVAEDLNLGEKVTEKKRPDSTVTVELAEPETRKEPEQEKDVLVGKININTANSSQLQLLPRVGPSTAEKIIYYRENIDLFRTIADITEVKGIGEKTLEKLAPHITVGDVAPSEPTTPEKSVQPSSAKPEVTSTEASESDPQEAPEDNQTESTEHTKININTASKQELTELNGIGDTYAERIIEYRQENDGFKTIDELTNVKGIGEKRLAKIRDMIILE